jgi:hypothetical protein
VAGTGRQYPGWLSLATQIAAPVTLVGGLLFYFGYVYTRAQYAYFGLDVDTIGLTPRDYVMRSPQPLLFPLIVLTALTAAGITWSGRIEAHVRTATESGRSDELARIRRRSGRSAVIGTAVLVAGLVLMLLQVWWTWPYLELVAAVVIGAGAAVTAMALRYLPYRATGAIAGLWVTVLAATVFAVSITAQWSGRGQAEDLAVHLDRLPAVILDTPDDLQLRNTVAAPEDLCWTGSAPDPACAARTDSPRYRYHGLRLLVQGPNAMFLVPSAWSASATTLEVPRTANVRLQYQFANTPPPRLKKST